MTQSEPVLEHRASSLQASALVVSLETPLGQLPDLLAEHRAYHTIGVVDSSGVLAGIIPVPLVIQDLLFDVMPEELLSDLLEPGRAASLTRELHARTAGELMHPPIAVPADATLREAVHILHHAELQGAPVVDEAGRVTGYLDLLDIMLAWWRERHPGGT